MLSIYFGSLENEIYNPDNFFNHAYIEDAWFEDTFTKDMIRDVDKSEVLFPGVIDSPVLGKIPAEKLSGGAKTLILINFYDKKDVVFNISACGDNCSRWLVDIGKRKDVTVTLHHVMRFPQNETFEIKILNTGKIVHDYAECIDEFTMLSFSTEE